MTGLLTWEQLLLFRQFQTENNKDEMDGAAALKNFIKKYIVYSLDANNFSSPDIKDKHLNKIKKILRKSRFNVKRKKLRGIAVEDGLSAIAISIVNEKVFFDVYRVHRPFTTSGDKIVKIMLYQEDTDYKEDNKLKRTFYKYAVKDGKTTMTKMTAEVQDIEGTLKTSSTDTHTTDYLPVVVLPNNEDYESQFLYIDKFIDVCSKHLNNINTEWEFDKAMLSINNIMNPLQDGAEIQKKIQDGEERVFEQMDPDGKYANTMNYVSSGGISSQVAQRNYDKFKSETLFYALSFLIVSDGRTNKHGAEVITTQLPSLVAIQFQIELMNEFYSNFISLYTIMLKETAEIGFSIEDNPEINVELSPILKAMVEAAAPASKIDKPEQEKPKGEK